MEAYPDDLFTERRRLRIAGFVQGVGFRPFVYRAAQHLGLTGWIYNDSQGVCIEVQGPSWALQRFHEHLLSKTPPLARIDHIEEDPVAIQVGEQDFVIQQSVQGKDPLALVRPDACVCPECLQEMHNPKDRRYRYPFINCTNCGPRYTIIQGVPYDRAMTTMAGFVMCPECQREYDDPLDRRFHAQPNACPRCGPQVVFEREQEISGDPFRLWAEAILSGQIVAVKGLGGYHLACNPFDEQAVKRLRQRKRRYGKPFAVMAKDLEVVERLCHVSASEKALLASVERPIVLLQRLDFGLLSQDVAGAYRTLGVMLPYTPLHVLLLEALDGLLPLPVVVMTSGNFSDEPIVTDNAEAKDRLKTVADAFVHHNRPIYIRCDDSIVKLAADNHPQLLRRSRGYVPDIIESDIQGPPLLAVGGELKNTFAFYQQGKVYLSHHLGDLENMKAYEAFEQGIQHFQRLFDLKPKYVVHDLHPGYLSTTFAQQMGLPTIAVQHHHAHVASVMMEHHVDGPVIGLAFDGTGYGPDKTIWGGEVLLATLSGFERVASLKPMPLIGGDRAIKEPWRIASALLAQIFTRDNYPEDLAVIQQIGAPWWQVDALARKTHSSFSVLTSSMGRLFDAAGVLMGLGPRASYEGEVAIMCEMAVQDEDVSSYPYAILCESPGHWRMDPIPMIQELLIDITRRESLSFMATRFHQTIADMAADTADLVHHYYGIDQVVLTGGVWQNQVLTRLTLNHLQERGLKVYLNHIVPPNDGGLALGQIGIGCMMARN
ncbi:carbamoyltransferase HypF [Sulfobacillus thermosulfidooxidans]|uniref:carbamoyltransferase HypF n=1 Tax=Sulfobacillus thermosulfidooxidans TaxID=28034 RepID=UPI0006B5743E|nr:carbamoyltransferase HypF [Sulfobacillus thermosulfidooxidans]